MPRISVSFKNTPEDLELYEEICKHSDRSGYVKDLIRGVIVRAPGANAPAISYARAGVPAATQPNMDTQQYTNNQPSPATENVEEETEEISEEVETETDEDVSIEDEPVEQTLEPEDNRTDFEKDVADQLTTEFDMGMEIDD